MKKRINWKICTLQGTNISPTSRQFWVDYLPVPPWWRVLFFLTSYFHTNRLRWGVQVEVYLSGNLKAPPNAMPPPRKIAVIITNPPKKVRPAIFFWGVKEPSLSLKNSPNKAWLFSGSLSPLGSTPSHWKEAIATWVHGRTAPGGAVVDDITVILVYLHPA